MAQAAGRAAVGLARAQFQVAGGQQEGHEHGHGIEIHLAVSGIGRVHRGNEGGHDAQRHRHVHAGAAMAQVVAGVAPDRPCRVQHHGHGQRETGPVHQHDGPVQRLQGIRGDAVVAQVAGPGKHHHLHHGQPGQRQAHQRVPALLAVDVGQAGGDGEDRFGSHAPILASRPVRRLDMDQAAGPDLPPAGPAPAAGEPAVRASSVQGR